MIKIQLDEGAYMPEKAHDLDAGYDLRTPYVVGIPAGGSAAIDTGVHIAIPKGYYGKLESKSGLNVNYDVVCLGGVIDSGYTGSIVVKLYNFGARPYIFEAGDKIVQLILQSHAVLIGGFDVVESLEDTERGNNGFGSTGR